MMLEARIRWVAALIVLLVSTFFSLLAFRFVSLPFLIAAWVFFLRYGRKRIRPSFITSAVWLMLTYSPIDVLPMPKGGAPRLVPLVMGLLTQNPKTDTEEIRGKLGAGHFLLGKPQNAQDAVK
jgi:hypothetical protein